MPSSSAGVGRALARERAACAAGGDGPDLITRFTRRYAPRETSPWWGMGRGAVSRAPSWGSRGPSRRLPAGEGAFTFLSRTNACDIRISGGFRGLCENHMADLDGLFHPNLLSACLSGDQMELGADVNQADFNGNTPLYMAIMSGCADIVEVLLHHGVNPNQAGDRGNLPLIVATMAEHPGLARLLLDHGADVYLAGNLVVKTPLAIARSLCPPGHARARTLYPAADLVIRRASSLAWAKLLAVLFAIKLVVYVRRARERVYMPGGRGARAAEASFERNMRQHEAILSLGVR